MKKHRHVVSAITFMLCTALILSTVIFVAEPVALSESSDIFTEEFLDGLSQADGAGAYQVEDKLLTAYNENSIAFLEELSTLSSDYQDFFVQFLVSCMYYDGDWSQFKSGLSSLEPSSDVTKDLIDKISSFATDYETSELEWKKAYDEWQRQPDPEGLISPEILLEAINSHSNAYLYDTEYCGYLREMYELDPNQFIDIISSLPEDSIQTIATQIALAQYNDLGDVKAVKASAYGTPVSTQNVSSKVQALGKSFSKDISKNLTDSALIAEANEIRAESEDSLKRANSINSISIGSISYNNITPPSQLEIKKAVTCKTTISRLSPNTKYRVKLYVRHVGSSTENLKGSKYVTSTSSGRVNASFNLTFSAPGDIMTTIKVYRGSSLVASRTGAYPDTVDSR